MKPALARDFTAPRADSAPTGRGELAPTQFTRRCDVCRAVTVHQVIVVAERQTVVCTDCEARR